MITELKIQDVTAKTVCAQLIREWENPEKKVFVLRTAPLHSDVREWYEALFPEIGTPAYLAEDVRIGDRNQQRTGGLWMEVRYDSRFPDAYRHSANAQPLHTDGSYIPSFPNASLMVCINNTQDGGATTFIDSKALVQTLTAEAPDLLNRLENTVVPHARSGDRCDRKIIRQENGRTLVNWNYYCVAKDVTPTVRSLVEEFHQFLLSSPGVCKHTHPVKLGPGDAVVWKDAEVLHGRNAFIPTRESDRFIWKCAIEVGAL